MITNELESNKGLKDYLKEKNCMSMGVDYRTVAVIGCQSSGKSKSTSKVKMFVRYFVKHAIRHAILNDG